MFVKVTVGLLSQGQLVPSVLHTVLGEGKWESCFSGQKVKKQRQFATLFIAHQGSVFTSP